MAVEVTPLGFQKPDGNELVKQGDNVIAANAQKAQDLHAKARADIVNLQSAAGFDGDPLVMQDAVVAALIGTASVTGTAVQSVANTAAANSTATIAPSGGARAVGKGELVVNVKDFGATGDGLTDDSEAVRQAALMARGPFGEGGKLVFPPGSYYWPGVVELFSNIDVDGKGASLVKRLPTDSTMFFGLYSRGKIGYGSGVNNLTIRGLTFKGDFASGRTAGGFGANHASHILVEDCVFEQCLGKGHTFDLGGVDDVTFRRCIFKGRLTGDAADNYNEYIQVDNSTRGGSSALDDPGSYDGLPSRNVTVEDCQFLPVTVGGVTYPAGNPFGSHYGIEGLYHENLKFLNNVVDSPVSDITTAYRGTLHFMSAQGITISGNTFINRSGNAGRAINALTLTSSISASEADITPMVGHTLATPQVCSDWTIENNKFIGFRNPNTTESVVLIRGNSLAVPIRGVRVIGNTFIDCFVADLAGTGPNLIEVVFCNNTKIRENKTNGARRLIYFASVEDLEIRSNYIANAATGYPVQGINGIRVRSLDNDFLNYDGGISLSTVDVATIRGNIYRGGRATGKPPISMVDVSRMKVTENDVNITVSSATGIYVAGGSGFIRNNTVTGHTTQIFIGGGSTATQSGNDTT